MIDRQSAWRPLRVTCFIDSLGPGGAQRQMSLLAVLLKRRGYDVEVLTYRPVRFFDADVEAADVPVRRVSSGKLRRAFAVRQAIRRRDPDVVIAFLDGPNVYAELAGLPSRRFGLIVSERTGPHGVSVRDLVRFTLHRLADVVVANSEYGRQFLAHTAPWLADKAEVIVNAVELARFHPSDASERFSVAETSVLVLARYEPEKNPAGMLAAMEWIRRTAPGAPIVLDWYGRTYFVDGQPGPLSRTYVHLEQDVRDRGLSDRFRLHDAVQDVVGLYSRASLLCLPSFYEGCSNVVCEALACGIPVVASDVGDNRSLVVDGETGFLCDPMVPRTIGEAILRFHELPARQKREMGRRARAHAEAMLAPERFASGYVALIERLAP